MEPSNPRTFWNLTNHPWDTGWSLPQKAAAAAWQGLALTVRDLPFPFVDPEADVQAVQDLAEQVFQALLEAGGRAGEPVLLQGEFSLVVALAPRLHARGLVPLCATSRRIAQEELRPDGTVIRSHVFQFVSFRSYYRL